MKSLAHYGIVCLFALAAASQAMADPPSSQSASPFRSAEDIPQFIATLSIPEERKGALGEILGGTTWPQKDQEIPLPNYPADMEIEDLGHALEVARDLNAIMIQRRIYSRITNRDYPVTPELLKVLAIGAGDFDGVGWLQCSRKLCRVVGVHRLEAHRILTEIVNRDTTGKVSAQIAAGLSEHDSPVDPDLLFVLINQVSVGFEAEGLALRTSILIFRNYSPSVAVQEILQWADQPRLAEIASGWGLYMGLMTDKPTLTAEDYQTLRSIPTRFIKSAHESVRIAGLRMFLSMLGPNLYATTEDQLSINRSVRAILIEHRNTESSEKVVDFLDNYLLLGFDDNGRLLDNAEWRARIEAKS